MVWFVTATTASLLAMIYWLLKNGLRRMYYVLFSSFSCASISTESRGLLREDTARVVAATLASGEIPLTWLLRSIDLLRASINLPPTGSTLAASEMLSSGLPRDFWTFCPEMFSLLLLSMRRAAGIETPLAITAFAQPEGHLASMDGLGSRRCGASLAEAPRSTSEIN